MKLNEQQRIKLNLIFKPQQMDYLEIVLQGYFNENNRKHLHKYFYRKFKEAEKEYFEADEFFSGCLIVIESWEKYLQDKVFERKNELYLMLDSAKNSSLKYNDLQGKTIKQKRLETIEYCEQELSDISKNNFTVHLHSLTNGRIAYNMHHNEVLSIKLAIQKAFQKIENINSEQGLLPQQVKDNESKTNELEKCIHLINYWTNEDETVIKTILNTETELINNYLNPFSKELNIHLLAKETLDSKKDLIKYYVFEFWELQGFYNKYNELLFTGSLYNYSPKKYEYKDKTGKKRKLNEFENYVVNSHILFDMLFNEIQLCCIKYKIAFYEICDELNFSTKYFDSGITLAFEEMSKKALPPQQINKSEPELIKNELSENINKYFGFFNGNCPRKHKQILKNEDFNKLIQWTNYYFENEFKVPEISEPINVVNTNKTFVQLAFKYLFKKLHKASPYPQLYLTFTKEPLALIHRTKKATLKR